MLAMSSESQFTRLVHLATTTTRVSGDSFESLYVADAGLQLMYLSVLAHVSEGSRQPGAGSLGETIG
jgi:hypothetical protein